MRHYHYVILGSLLTLSLTAGQAQAEPSAAAPTTDQTMSEVVVTATKLENDLHELGSAVTVITAADLDKTQQTRLIDALRAVPALDVANYGGTTSVFIRGAKAEHTLVLLDGVELNDPSIIGRTYDLSHLRAANVERIEIVRGPQSTLYGSDAIGGVINIITKRGSGQPSGFVAVDAGSFNSFSESAGLNGSSGKLNYSLGLSRLDSDGISAAARKYGNHEHDAYRNTNFSSRLGFKQSSNLDADLIVRYIEAKADLDNAGGVNGDDPNNNSDTRQLFMRTQARAALLNGLWEQKLGVSLSSIERTYQNNADIDHPSDYETGDYEGQSFKFDWQHNLYLTEANTLTLGLESEKEQMKSDYLSQSIWGTYPSTFDNRAAHTAGYYLQDQIKLWDNWLTTLGVRLDDHSRFGTKSTYRLTSSYRIKASATRFKGSYGTGFKTPSLYQLYDLTYGNLNLRPETSTGWDLGLEQQLGPKWLTLELTYYRNYFRKMIDYDSATQKYLNRGAAETKGIEAAFKARPTDDLSLTAGYTCSRTQDKTTRDKLLRRPHDKAFVNVDYRFLEKARVNLGVVAVGKRDDAYWDAASFSTKRVKLNNYNLVNLALSYELTENLLLTGRIENLTDAHYEEVYGYGVNGRSAYAGLRLNF